MNEQDRRDALADRALVAVLALVDSRTPVLLAQAFLDEPLDASRSETVPAAVARLAAAWLQAVQARDAVLDEGERQALEQQARSLRARLDACWKAVDRLGVPALRAETAERVG